MGYVVQGLAYVAGGALLGGGAYLLMRGDFPGWWRERLLWPLAQVTPAVARFQGWAAIGLGLSILAIGFTPIVPKIAAGALVLVAMVAYLAAVALFLYSTWLSRRMAR
ncbi:MAG TPA: hypothetical protein VMW11_09155 [Candidatus Dormibacteraeota bacterium]|nr:hypothetical protein [Candidatus Dormibacteraeota bacterium]